MRRAVHFGAGNIGRGFLGQLYFESGFETTFVDVSEKLIEEINRRGQYPIRLVAEFTKTITVGHVRAVHADDTAAVAEAVAKADIASTAVGVNVLGNVAPPLAAGLVKRFETRPGKTLDVLICENLLHGSDFLRERVRALLEPKWHEDLARRVGFVEASIGRMVPIMTPEQMAEDPLLVCVEPYCELPVDRDGFRGMVPPIRNLHPKPNFQAYVERKLFVHNCGHAAAAYLGHLRGHEYIWEAMADDAVRHEVSATMGETCAALQRRYGLPESDLRDHAADLAARFANRALGDQIARVGADPVRKLGRADRLIGAMALCRSEEVECPHVAMVAAAALRFDPPGDPTARRVRELVAERGVRGAILALSGLPDDSPLVQAVVEADRRLDIWLGSV
ncbi:MAG: mannitol-1-phosphate 5-dehydrogenase [Fimbriimonadaceae bacterium]